MKTSFENIMNFTALVNFLFCLANINMVICFMAQFFFFHFILSLCALLFLHWENSIRILLKTWAYILSRGSNIPVRIHFLSVTKLKNNSFPVCTTWDYMQSQIYIRFKRKLYINYYYYWFTDLVMKAKSKDPALANFSLRLLNIIDILKTWISLFLGSHWYELQPRIRSVQMSVISETLRAQTLNSTFWRGWNASTIVLSKVYFTMSYISCSSHNSKKMESLHIHIPK